jgi:hypothetical protein
MSARARQFAALGDSFATPDGANRLFHHDCVTTCTVNYQVLIEP